MNSTTFELLEYTHRTKSSRRLKAAGMGNAKQWHVSLFYDMGVKKACSWLNESDFFSPPPTSIPKKSNIHGNNCQEFMIQFANYFDP